MCFVSKAKPPKPAPPTPPAPVLEQVAPELTEEESQKARKRVTGTKRYRAGGALSIPTSTGASSGGLNIAGGS